MTADFSHLRALAAPAERTARFTFFEVEGSPWVETKQANETNRTYWSAALKEGKPLSRAMARTGLTPKLQEEDRAIDRRLFAVHVVTGWGGWKDSSGNEAAFNRENVQAMLEALPYELFERFRSWAKESGNFQEMPEADLEPPISDGGPEGSRPD